jgi:hypothetical protein
MLEIFLKYFRFRGQRDLQKCSDPSQGILVHLATETEIDALREPANGIALVAEVNGTIGAYCLCYRLQVWERLRPTWRECISVHSSCVQLNPQSTLYFRHIATRQKIATFSEVLELECALLREAKEKLYGETVGEIVSKPDHLNNRRSFRIHEHLGYQIVGTVKYPTDAEDIEWALLHQTIA